jgi:hypothetical protein
MTLTSIRLLGAMALVTGVVACSDGTSGPATGAQISFNVATHAAGAAPSRPLASPDTIVDAGGNVLVLTKVELVLKEIELKRQEADACDDLGGDNDECEEFETGPFVLDLPLGVGVSHQVTITADSGTFDEIEFKIHTPEDDGDAADQAFLAAHPGLQNVSIRVTGTFNGVDFVFVTDLNADEEVAISPPLVVAAEGNVDVTLMVDVAGWFLNGALVIDPSLGLKGGPLEAVVKNNIEASFDAFHDDDHDGHDDDGSDD